MKNRERKQDEGGRIWAVIQSYANPSGEFWGWDNLSNLSQAEGKVLGPVYPLTDLSAPGRRQDLGLGLLL